MASAFDDLEALRATFFEEADERLHELERALLQLEADADSKDLLHSIFRDVHSLKGGAAACGLDDLAGFAHVFENLLAPLRFGELRLGQETMALMLESVDTLKALVLRARNVPDSVDPADIDRTTLRIRSELASAGLESSVIPAPALATPPEDGVVWFDELATTPPSAPPERATAATPPRSAAAPALPAAVAATAAREESQTPAAVIPAPPPVERKESSPPAPAVEPSESAQSEPLELEEGEAFAEIDTGVIARLIDLTLELAIATSALNLALQQPEGTSEDKLRALVSDSQVHADALQHALSHAHASSTQALSEMVLVKVMEHSFFLPHAAISEYRAASAAEVREVPHVGQFIQHQGEVLRLIRLASFLFRDPGEPKAPVAILMHGSRPRCALLVDEVVATARVAVRPLDHCFGDAHAYQGAAVYAGKAVLVLNPSVLIAQADRPLTPAPTARLSA